MRLLSVLVYIDDRVWSVLLATCRTVLGWYIFLSSKRGGSYWGSSSLSGDLSSSRILDMLRTVVNVTGDATVATVIASTEGQLNFDSQKD